MEARRSDAHSGLPLKICGPEQIPFFTHLDATKERYQGQVIYKDGFGQKVVFMDIH
jgi:hypothetical protein